MIGSVIVLVALGCTSGEPVAPTPAEPAVVPQEGPQAEPPVAADPAPAPLPAPTDQQYAASHILIAWAGAVRAPKGTTRTKAQARELAERLRDKILADGSLEQLAREHSDGPSAPRGGSIGVYMTGTMVPDFEAAVASVQPGELGPLVETPFGWHVVRRDAVTQVRVRHLLVSHSGAHQSVSERTRDEARAIADTALGRIQAGEDFAAVVAELSDDAPTAQHGGDIGWIAPGQMVPGFEAAAMALAKGQTSEVVETAYGFHVLNRTE